MTAIAVVPTGYNNDYTDFLHAKCDRDGCVRLVTGSVTVPAATADAAYIGLVPFQAGARFVIDSNSVYSADLDSGTDNTLDLGIVYFSTADGTDNDTAFASASTAAQAGGFISVDEIAGMTLRTTGRGWLVVQNNGAVTDTEGAITFRVGVCYDN